MSESRTEPPGAARTLVLLRHGETTWNAAHRIQGQVDSELSPTGLAQAAAVAPGLAALRPVAVWTSDLQRAAVTARHVAGAAGLEVRTDPRLREFGLGEREGVTHEDYAERWPQEYVDFVTGRWSSVPGAETLQEVRARVEACLTELADTLPADGLAVAVAHGAALRVAVEALVAGTASEPSAYSGMTNCGYAVLRERPLRRSGEPRWRLVAYNRTADAGA
ncbi:histidine phosphatase family protein [Nocardioides sp. ChNu-153]|uniref:histidine phosphatase family protein n=1 Tax=unclassified Nocardioides TaxID=2615069 RepID=UPI002407242F|nr:MULTISPECIES: histidine phosphatase family protein [unclassified Nocardioides]MDF9715552.1 histidine phosphatase family protein [Nocardioides sp. ChNu-99]MDN7120693.1 histidine phosphatase family protein [Nocardioides sp. ChNu-153]